MTHTSRSELAMILLGLTLFLSGLLGQDTRPSWICTDYDADALLCRGGGYR